MKLIVCEHNHYSYCFKLTVLILYIAPADFIATTLPNVVFDSNVVIDSNDTELCVQFNITDDDIALEGDEKFTVSFDIKSDNATAIPGNGATSTVTIVDNDG